MLGRELTLLERLRYPRADLPRTTRQDTQALADSILDNLRKLLNTHQGNVLTLSDYGIPSILDVAHSFLENITAFQQAIRRTIERYEPRLRNVRVKYAPLEDDPMCLHFEITAQMSTSVERASLLFETTLDSRGHINVIG